MLDHSLTSLTSFSTQYLSSAALMIEVGEKGGEERGDEENIWAGD